VAADGSEALLRHVPHRVGSTTAKVDAATIAERPCFLCAKSLPPEQRGLPWRDEWVLLCNPFPVVGRHLTVVHRDHLPQRIEGLFPVLLDLAAELPGSFTLYNGPRCGASAPDHLHLQAGDRAGLPIVREAAACGGVALRARGARALLFHGDRGRVLDAGHAALEALAAVAPQEPEPWCNVAAWHEPGAGFSLVVFPRAKHRPDAFHRGERTVSPASIDMSGILVTPMRKDFDALGSEEAAAIYDEVSIGEEPFREVVARLEGR